MTPEEIQQAREIARETLNTGGWFAPSQPSVDKLARAVLALTEQLHQLGYPPETYGMVKGAVRQYLTEQPEPEPVSRCDMFVGDGMRCTKPSDHDGRCDNPATS
jgi:hypothetical protein